VQTARSLSAEAVNGGHQIADFLALRRNTVPYRNPLRNEAEEM